jgi:hypothetical protein
MLVCAGCFAAGVPVDASTLNGKLIMGYQGWFACPADTGNRGWAHWFSGSKPTVDLLPDVSELSPSERCPTGMVARDGRPVELFSDQNPRTVERHFAWMEDYGLDGVALERFANQLLDPDRLRLVDGVLGNVRHAAEDHGRVFFVMYDLSGMPSDRLSAVVDDWKTLEQGGLTGSSAYLRHRGRPVLGIWGIGFAGRPQTPADAELLLKSLRAVSGPFGGITILGGVPAWWATGVRDASPDPGWRNVWKTLDIISPWTVGRYADNDGADAYRASTLATDLKVTRAIGVDYMPVIFPGFSAANAKRAHGATDNPVMNKIPRRCGSFYWRQAFNAVQAGATMIYGAMFDEVDEGTAMFKLEPSAGRLPATPSFLGLDADGCRLPADWYLRLAGAATEMVHGKLPVAENLPLDFPAH